MAILSWIVVGLAAGSLLNNLMKDENTFGLIRESLISVGGAILSGLIAGLLLKVPSPLVQIDFATIIVAAVGAVALLALMRSIFKGSPM